MALSDLPADDLARIESRLAAEYDALADKGLALDLTRGKPSPEQLDLSEALLSLPGEGDHLAGKTDVRNYGGGAGLPELRSIIAELLGTETGRVIAQDNASLSIMYDLLVFSMLFGTPDSQRPWGSSQDGRRAGSGYESSRVTPEPARHPPRRMTVCLRSAFLGIVLHGGFA